MRLLSLCLKYKQKSAYKVSFFSKLVKTNAKDEKREVTDNVKRTQEEGMIMRFYKTSSIIK